MMGKNSKIYVAGHKGLVGSAILRALKKKDYTNIITRTKEELDLLNQSMVKTFFKEERPEYVFLAAAKVGGILANDTYPAQFIFQNLQIQNNIIHNSYLTEVTKLVFLGSSCVYPKFPDLPINENSLLTGFLEPTNEAYAIAKISGIKMCQAYAKEYGCNFISLMPTNLYGPNDNYHPENSHVLAALIRKVMEGKIKTRHQITLWGSGKPMREFLQVDDLADACLFLIQRYDSPEIINIGTGTEISIEKLAKKIMIIADYSCEIVYDDSKPDGTFSKVLNVSKLFALGWKPKISLDEGLRMSIKDYISRYYPTER